MDFRPAPQHTQPNGPTPPEVTSEPVPSVQPVNNKKGDKVIRRSKNLALWLVVALVIIAALGAAAYFNKRYHDSQQQVKKLSSNPTITAQQEQQQLIEKVGKLTLLPAGETPTVATVTDITKLKDQPFFATAQNGDKVLIYTGAKKAYLYRPSTNKLINIAPVNIGNQTSATGTSTTTTTTTPTPTKKP